MDAMPDDDEGGGRTVQSSVTDLPSIPVTGLGVVDLEARTLHVLMISSRNIDTEAVKHKVYNRH